MMSEKQLKVMLFFKNMAGSGLLIGFTVIIASFFVSGINGEYIFSIGLSVMVSSMLLFGFGLFINLMEEMAEGSKGIK